MQSRKLYTYIFLLFSFPAFSQTFIEASLSRGIQHEFQGRGLMGGGCAFFDVDNDGDDDLYLNGGWNRDDLYINEDGSFTKVNQDIGLNITGRYYTCSISVGDLDNDGFKDLLVTSWVTYDANGREEISRNLLFHNNGNGTFTEIGWNAGLVEKAFSIASNLFDYNQDGLLDIYINNHVETPEFVYDDNGLLIAFDHECYENHFYLNQGNMQFSEISADLMIDSDGCTLASLPTDIDGDGDMDLIIANDFGPFITPNQLYQNNFPNPFTSAGESTNTNQAIYGMGIAIGDYDRDEDMDYYITNLGSNLLLNNDNTVFTDQASFAGVENEKANEFEFSTGWGTAFMDINNNGFEDLFICNGRIPSLSSLPTAISDPDKLYLNNQDGTFNDISVSAGVGHNGYSRGMAFSDVDQDGDLDFFVMTINEFLDTGKLYINQGNSNNYISFKLEGSVSNRDAFGAKLLLYTSEGTQIRELFAGGASHCSQHTNTTHFGIGTLESVDSLEVIWPSGSRSTVYDLAINRTHSVKEESPSSAQNLFSSTPFIKVYPNPFNKNIRLVLKEELIEKVTAYQLLNMNTTVVSSGSLDKKVMNFIDLNIPQGQYILQILFEDRAPQSQLVLKF